MRSPEIRKYFEEIIDKDYTGATNVFQLNRLFKDTIYKIVNDRIANLTTIKNYDEISFLLKVNQPYTPNLNKIILGTTPIVSVSIVSPTQYQITSGFSHGLITGDSIIISGVEGTTNANGSYSVTVLSATSFTIIVASAIGTNTANTGSFYGGKQVSDYYRLKAIKTTFRNNNDFKITKASNSSPIRITFVGVNNIADGEQVYITGVSGNTNANGAFYVKKINSQNVDLYLDSFMKIPVSGNATYVNGGKLSTVYSEYATPEDSNTKISLYSRGTIDYPKYEENQHSLTIYPTDYVCVNATLDYVTLPKEIDFSDTKTDYSLYYNDKFIFYLIDESAKAFLAMLRDSEGYGLLNNEVAQNK